MTAPLRSVGRYDLIEEVGRGGAAIVYLAHQPDLRREVAVKQLAPYQSADPAFAARFLQESRMAGSLSHPNVVTVHEYFEHDAVPYIAMEYLSRGSLRSRVGKLSTAQFAGVMEGVLAGLSHGEEHGIVHRDLKPENLLVAADGRVKIADFGIAKAFNTAFTSGVRTAVGTTIGTPAYMAPEQATGRSLGPATDLYSLGIIAWELLVGRVPFEETDSPVAVLYRHVHEPVPPVRSANPAVEASLDAWVARMVAKEPPDRFAGADAAWEALEDIVITLLGPRWRRQARLPSDGATGQPERPLTPAPFGQTQDDTPPAQPQAPSEPAVAEHRTVAPREAVVNRPTVHHVARRHRDDEEAPDPEPAVSPRRRAVVGGALAVAVALAAAVGVLLGSGGGAAPRRVVASSNAVALAATQARTQLLAILQGVASARSQGLTRLAAAGTGAEQAVAASVIRRAYADGVTQIDRLAPATRTGADAARLRLLLDATARAYASLSAAARSESRAAYAALAAEIAADEREVQAESAALARVS